LPNNRSYSNSSVHHNTFDISLVCLIEVLTAEGEAVLEAEALLQAVVALTEVEVEASAQAPLVEVVEETGAVADFKVDVVEDVVEDLECRCSRQKGSVN
jgi:hypothetical protein